jgi:hypothetical protein
MIDIDQIYQENLKWAENLISYYEQMGEVDKAYSVYREWDEFIVADALEEESEIVLLTTPYFGNNHGTITS